MFFSCFLSSKSEFLNSSLIWTYAIDFSLRFKSCIPEGKVSETDLRQAVFNDDMICHVGD